LLLASRELYARKLLNRATREMQVCSSSIVVDAAFKEASVVEEVTVDSTV
jgi:hypothetical protein